MVVMRQLLRSSLAAFGAARVSFILGVGLLAAAGSAVAQVPAPAVSGGAAASADAGMDAQPDAAAANTQEDAGKAIEMPTAPAPSSPEPPPAPISSSTQPILAPAAEPVPEAPAAQKTGGIPKMVKMITAIAGGVGAISLGLGVGFSMASNSYAAEVDYLWSSLRKDGGPGACNLREYEIRCRELEGAHNDAQVMKSVAVTSFIFMGVSIGAVGYGVVSYLIPKKSQSTKQGSAGPSLSVGAMPGGGAAVLRGTF